MEVVEWSNQKSVIWMAAHARLKNEFTEDEKYHNLMTWLIFSGLIESHTLSLMSIDIMYFYGFPVRLWTGEEVL